MTSKNNFEKIRLKEETKFISYFTKAMEFYTPDLRLENINIIKKDEIVYILSGLLNIKDEPISSKSVRRLIEEAIRTCKKGNIKDSKEIIEILNKIYSSQKSKPVNNYYVIASLHINKEDLPKQSGNLFDSYFSTYGAKHFFKKFKLQRFINPPFEKIREGMKSFIMLTKDEIDVLNNSEYLEIKVKSEDVESAFDEGWNKIERYRSIINYSLCLGSFRLLGRTKPFSVLLPSAYIFVFNNNNELEDYWYTLSLDEKNMSKIEKSKDKQLKSDFNFVIRKLGKIKDRKLLDIFYNVFLRHGKGLDEIVHGTSFISFWQSLELIALKPIFNFSEKDVSERIKSLMPNEKLKAIIDVLYQKRNYLIHEGEISGYDLSDINYGKEISELAIYSILKHIQKFDDVNELNFYYKYSTRNNVDIKKIEKILKYIKKLRNI